MDIKTLDSIMVYVGPLFIIGLLLVAYFGSRYHYPEEWKRLDEAKRSK